MIRLLRTHDRICRERKCQGIEAGCSGDDSEETENWDGRYSY